MSILKAIKEIRSKRNREWLRYNGKDYLAEKEVKKVIKAARLLADEIEKQ